MINSIRALSALITGALIVALPLASRAQSPELRILQVQYDNAMLDRVTDVYNAALGSLDANYISGLDRSLSDATAAGDLEGALSLQAEKKRIANKEALPANDEQASKILRKLRGIYRVELAKLDAQRAANQTAVLTPHLEKLKQLEVDLTKATRLTDAKAVMDYRQGLASGVPQKVVTTIPSPAVASTPPTPPSSFSPPPAGGFTNTLGMKFVPVLSTRVLFCIHSTRVKDYAAYVAESAGVDSAWKNQKRDDTPIGSTDEEPVVSVSWDDAQSFCAWLSKKEGRTYRLPTDREWSFAVGIGEKEKITKDTTPESLDQKILDVYPWGTQWPPPKGAGNFLDVSSNKKFPDFRKYIEGYTDGFPLTSPVMSFKPNKLGLYDMGGNNWQWCEDWFSEAHKGRVLRGGSWRDLGGWLLSSRRIYLPQNDRRNSNGFRVVVESSAR